MDQIMIKQVFSYFGWGFRDYLFASQISIEQ